MIKGKRNKEYYNRYELSFESREEFNSYFFKLFEQDIPMIYDKDKLKIYPEKVIKIK